MKLVGRRGELVFVVEKREARVCLYSLSRPLLTDIHHENINTEHQRTMAKDWGPAELRVVRQHQGAPVPGCACTTGSPPCNVFSAMYRCKCSVLKYARDWFLFLVNQVEMRRINTS